MELLPWSGPVLELTWTIYDLDEEIKKDDVGWVCTRTTISHPCQWVDRMNLSE